MPQARVLLVEDDEVSAALAQAHLQREGFEVALALDGQSALKALEQRPDIIVLDILLPDIDGLAVCREVRKTLTTPILMLSARGEDVHKIVGLEMGADDYLAKPFNPLELVARVRALLRRARMPTMSGDVILRHRLKIDLGGQTAEIDGRPITLTVIEFSLLRVLANNAGRVMTRQELLDRAWAESFDGYERTVDVHIRNLRQKLQREDPDTHYIVSVRGVGYKFEA